MQHGIAVNVQNGNKQSSNVIEDTESRNEIENKIKREMAGKQEININAVGCNMLQSTTRNTNRNFFNYWFQRLAYPVVTCSFIKNTFLFLKQCLSPSAFLSTLILKTSSCTHLRISFIFSVVVKEFTS